MVNATYFALDPITAGNSNLQETYRSRLNFIEEQYHVIFTLLQQFRSNTPLVPLSILLPLFLSHNPLFPIFLLKLSQVRKIINGFLTQALPTTLSLISTILLTKNNLTYPRYLTQ